MTCEVASEGKMFPSYRFLSVFPTVWFANFNTKPQTHIRSEIQVWGFPVPPHLVGKGLW